MNMPKQEIIARSGVDVVPIRQHQEPSSTGQDLALISLFERLALDPSIPLDRVKEVIALQKDLQAQRALSAFTIDMARLQPMLPTVEQNGRLVIKEKGTERVIQSTPYAKWEDINEAIRGPLGECGFALTFRAERVNDQVVITGILSHREGHQERTTISLALDSTGSKNNVQAVGSSISYGKRYTAGMLLNITSRAKFEADDDGKAAGDAANISEEQEMALRDMLQAAGADEKKFCQFIKVEHLRDILASKFDDAVKIIKAKRPSHA
jgi:hypothetical protein